ncbi:MAG: SPOR domain-containing protein [Bacteroidetes bacterium]|nr:SPOR domain-containing protein [Bacteroidota bacterium]
MPDFNFAKGNSKREEETSSSSAGQQPTGQQRPVSAHPQAGLSDDLQASPERSSHPISGAPVQGSSNPGTAAQRPSPPAPGATKPRRGSVLDKYPERDLSRLTATGTSASPADPLPETVPQHDDTADSDSAAADQAEFSAGDTPPPVSTTATEGSMSTSSSKGPLIAFLTIAALLIIVAFIWHVNPWPALKDSIAGFFGQGKTEVQKPASEALAPASETETAPTMRAWDFFVQVSSWKALGQADLDAERFRAQGFDVVVESEFIPAKGGTWYRVRLGPYESSSAAREILASGAGVLPKGVYVDSVRLTEDQPMTPAPAAQKAKTRRPGSTPQTAAESGNPRLPGRDFEVIDEPMSGWAVKVSSLKSEDLARQEARKILAQGYPSFITRKNIGGMTWYRVLVGPFSEKRDADRYQQLLNVTYGNDAYTVNLSID